MFQSLARSIQTQRSELRIIDLGGTTRYWATMGFGDDPAVRITAVNLLEPDEDEPTFSNITYVQGSATALEFEDNEFDIAFSNSVIEHVGGERNRLAMAHEVRRLAPAYFVQTPARSFVIEPHFRSPLCHPWLPDRLRAAELRRIRKTSKERAVEMLATSDLLNFRDFSRLFPDATRYVRERFLGLTKSYIAIRGAQASRSVAQGLRT